ncbi:hypothetical protein [Nocardia sp. NPDC005366]|uniref:hypothetical protein n=1 Tax=Nocardia sp. NPDC005366 TaxID=3156878 RepID=UPI0033B9974E
MAGTSLPLAAAAAVATLLAAPAGAVPNDPTTPTTPAPAQPGAESPTETAPGTAKPDPAKPDPAKPDPAKPESKPTPSQPGITTPDPDQVMPDPKKDPKLAAPTQPGVTTPRVAPLPVPGQPAQPATAEDPKAPATGATPTAPGATQPSAPGTATPGSGTNTPAAQPESETLVQQPPRWEAPRLESAPAAPVVEMTGPRTEVGANIDGGNLLPGFVANTHHFSNAAGYVGTVGYRTPTGAGEAGVSVEFVSANTIQITSYTGGEGLADNKSTTVLDTTQVNLAKAAVEQWIAAQPGGTAALEAAAQAKLPPLVAPGDIVPQTVDVAGITTQWGGSVQY